MSTLAALFTVLCSLQTLVSAEQAASHQAAPIPSAAKPLTFDAASVKPAAPLGEARPAADGKIIATKKGGRPGGGPGTTDPGRIYYPSMSLKQLVMKAYDVKTHQVVGPAWLPTERFDIVATMPPDTTQEQLREMLRNLLAERFLLKVHRETKELPIFALVVGKNGPKLKQSADVPPKEGPIPRPSEPPKVGTDGFPEMMEVAGRAGIFNIGMGTRCRMIFQYQTMQDLADELPISGATRVSRPVKDETGLKGKYDFTLTFAPEGMPGAPAATQPEAGSLPDIYAALQAQLGLKLEPKNGPVELIVIDRAEKTPTGN